MELSTLNVGLSNQIVESNKDLKSSLSQVPILFVKPPTIQDLITKAQQHAIQYEEELEKAKQEQERHLPNLPELLRNDKIKAQKLIDNLVASAKEIKSSIVSSLTSVPIHPYERLIYDCLGPNFKAPSIEEYSIPDEYNALSCLREIKLITEDFGDLIMTQTAQITAESFASDFNGNLSENLNHGFAVPSLTSEGKTQWTVNKEKMTDHMRFVEMVKNIPIDYINKHPIEVAKIVLSEFIRIHKSSRKAEEESDLSYNLNEDVWKNPVEEVKKLFGNYNQLNGNTDNDINSIFKLFDNYEVPLALKN